MSLRDSKELVLRFKIKTVAWSKYGNIRMRIGCDYSNICKYIYL